MKTIHFTMLIMILFLNGCASTKTSTEYYFPPDTTITDYPLYYPNVSASFTNPAYFDYYYSGNYRYRENISFPKQ